VDWAAIFVERLIQRLVVASRSERAAKTVICDLLKKSRPRGLTTLAINQRLFYEICIDARADCSSAIQRSSKFDCSTAFASLREDTTGLAQLNALPHAMEQPGSLTGFGCSDGELAADDARLSAAQARVTCRHSVCSKGHHFALRFKGPA
jgi:hypothetical protein